MYEFMGRAHAWIAHECGVAIQHECVAAAGMVHQDAPHHLRGDGEELAPVLPGGRALAEQAEVGLVHEGRGLQRVARPLATQAVRRPPPQLLVDQRKEAVAGGDVPLAPGLQQLRHFQGHR